MTVLANTAEHLVEFEDGILTIARRTDGHAIGLQGKNIAKNFLDCLKTHSPERVIQTFIRLNGHQEWQPLYKPHKMQ